MKRRFLQILLIGLLCLSVACGNSSGNNAAENSIPLPGDDSTASEVALEPLPDAGLLNPLTGREGLEGAVVGQRPVAIALENTSASLPLRGISGLDVLVEGPNERGTTTLLAMFGDFRMVPQVGPVGDIDDPLLQFALPTNAIPVHLDVSPYAANLLNVLAYQDVRGTNVGTTGFAYDAARAQTAGGNRYNENCWYTDANLIWNAASAVGLNPIGEVSMMFHFASSALPTAEDAVDIHFSFSDTSPVSVYYDVGTNTYQKTAYGIAQVDETGAAMSFDNVFVLLGNVQKKADSLFLEYSLTSGDGYYFQGGRVTPIHWQKGGPTDPLRLLTADGEELQVQQGKSYLAFLPETRRESLEYLNMQEREQAMAEAAAAEAAAAEAAAAEAAAAEAAAAEAAAAEAAAAEAAAAEAAAAEAAAAEAAAAEAPA